jgi:hypothetical protein
VTMGESAKILFLAMGWGGGGPFLVADLLHLCDWINRTIPSRAELVEGLGELLAGRLIERSGDHYAVTADHQRDFHALAATVAPRSLRRRRALPGRRPRVACEDHGRPRRGGLPPAPRGLPCRLPRRPRRADRTVAFDRVRSRSNAATDGAPPGGKSASAARQSRRRNRSVPTCRRQRPGVATNVSSYGPMAALTFRP